MDSSTTTDQQLSTPAIIARWQEFSSVFPTVGKKRTKSTRSKYTKEQKSL
jgi:hypothetical protein